VRVDFTTIRVQRANQLNRTRPLVVLIANYALRVCPTRTLSGRWASNASPRSVGA
jgi:hypothetical protein